MANGLDGAFRSSFPKGLQRYIATVFVANRAISSSEPHATREQERPDIADPACRKAFHAVISSIAGSCSVSGPKTLSSGEQQVRSSSGSFVNSSYVRVQEYAISMQSTPQMIPASQFNKSAAVAEFERRWRACVVFQKDSVYRRYKRLCVFDMDSTLIRQEVIDEIARKLHVEAQVSAITERAMNGELDFEASLRERVALLKGTPAAVFEELKDIITLTKGASDLVRVLKKLGFKTAVLSGGFTPLTSWQAGQLGLDYAYANHLELSEDGATLTGKLTGEVVDAARKRTHVLQIAAKEAIPLEQVIVVGDGANDLPMMGVAGLGVAFNAKPRVQELAATKLNTDSLIDVLYLLGLTDDDIAELLN